MMIASCVEMLSKRSQRLALLGQFIEALDHDERVAFICTLRTSRAISEPSADALEEVYITGGGA